MILLADGGSTKVDWRLVDEGKDIKQIETKGINPFFRSVEEIREELKTNLLPFLPATQLDGVYFFGAGCVGGDKNEIVERAIREVLSVKEIEVDSDLVAAARGLCGREKGIACILGTGSNSCYYDGKEIEHSVSPLGYILGDEGSGAVLGRLFIGACLKNQLTESMKEEFLQYCRLTPVEIIDKVYRQPLPNRFLASFSPFIRKHLDDATVYGLVYDAFRLFFVRNVMQYAYKGVPVHLTGSVAYHYKEVLYKVAEELSLRIDTIVASPMEGLIKYYSSEKTCYL